jgi:hypothetical protein
MPRKHLNKLTILIVVVCAFIGLMSQQNILHRSLHKGHEEGELNHDETTPLSFPHQQHQLRKNLNILTLGGSITWGAAIPDKQKAYPYMFRDLDGHSVTNLAIRGTGADYPASCITSMLNDAENDDSQNYDPNVPFDVIIFEFSINGINGFELLFKRLKERFPDALLIYIDLWSLSRSQIDSSEARKMVEDAGGYVYYLGNKDIYHPTTHFDFHDLNLSPEITQPDWIVELFADDSHHLSQNGHSLVRDVVKSIIEQNIQLPENPKFGSWLGGDVCESWFQDGNTSLQIIEGGSMQEFDVDKHKWAIETEDSGLVLEYFHVGENAAQIKFNYMTKATKKFDATTSKYPPVLVKIEQDEAAIANLKRPEIGSDAWVDPVENGIHLGFFSASNWDNEGWTFIEGLNRSLAFRESHVSESSAAGMIQPGKNFLLIYPMDKKEYPFRITATIICEACAVLGIDLIE